MTLPKYSHTGKKTNLEKIIPGFQQLLKSPDLETNKIEGIQKSLLEAQNELNSINAQVESNLENFHSQILKTESAQLEYHRIEKETEHLFPYKFQHHRQFNDAVQLRKETNDRMILEIKKLSSMLPTECDWYYFPKIERAVYSMNNFHADIQKF